MKRIHEYFARLCSRLPKWLDYYWYEYLFSKAHDPSYTTWWKRIKCRARGHGEVWWYNSGGLEPDMHCKDCGDDLG